MTITKKYWIVLLAALAATLLLGCLLQPLYLSLVSDIVLQESFFTAALYYFDTVLEELIFATLIALLAAGEYLFYQKTKLYWLTKIAAVGVALVKYLCNLFVTAADVGFDNLTPTDFESLGLSLILDFVILFAAVLASALCVKKHFEKAAILEKAYRTAGRGEYDERAAFYPFRRFVSVKTPVLSGVFFGTIFTLAFKVLSSLYYDLFFWGFPETGEDWAQIVENYLGILILAVVSYTFAYFLSSFLLKEKTPPQSEAQIDQ